MNNAFKWTALLVSASMILSSCGGGHDEHEGPQHQVEGDSTHADHHADHNHANHHMNETPFDSLVVRFENPEREEWQRPEEVLRFMGDLKGKTIVDIGAGTGYFSFRMSPHCAKVIAADVDQRFLDYITERILREEVENIETRKAEYEHPPVKEKEADYVILVDVYHHIENRADYFREVKKGLKKGGELVIVDFRKGDLPVGPPDEIKLSDQQVISELKEAGFEPVASDTTTLAYQYMIRLK